LQKNPRPFDLIGRDHIVAIAIQPVKPAIGQICHFSTADAAVMVGVCARPTALALISTAPVGGAALGLREIAITIGVKAPEHEASRELRLGTRNRAIVVCVSRLQERQGAAALLSERGRGNEPRR
jgi:hypothetical protein